MILRLVLYILAASDRSLGEVRVLDPQPIISVYHLISVCATFLRREANIPVRKRSRHVYLEANTIRFNVNQPKAKTNILSVCIPGYAATCLLHSVDRSFAYVVHS